MSGFDTAASPRRTSRASHPGGWSLRAVGHPGLEDSPGVSNRPGGQPAPVSNNENRARQTAPGTVAPTPPPGPPGPRRPGSARPAGARSPTAGGPAPAGKPASAAGPPPSAPAVGGRRGATRPARTGGSSKTA